MKMDFLQKMPYIFDIWNEYIQKDPNKPWIFDEAATNGYTRLQADQMSARVYAYLKKNGIGREDFVMICMPRCAYTMIAMLGVWKAGAAFTIVDNHYSEERLDFIRQDCKCKLTIDMDLWNQMMEQEPLAGYEPTDPHDAAYAVYTSGSTGTPKGVLQEFGKIKLDNISLLHEGQELASEHTRFAIASPLNFIAAIKTATYSIYGGHSYYIVPLDVVKNPIKLKEYFIANRITDTFLTPSLIRIAKDGLGPYLERVVTGSESANGISLDGVKLVNNYGMSEAGFVLAQYVIDKPYDPAPIGKPLYKDIELLLLDEDGKPVPDGEHGEICFENPFFRGYINREEETKNAFRFGVFHTNDMGVKDADGNFYVVGRANDMIKINGNRVEPAEIEAQAKQLLGIDWCAVKGFTENGEGFLCMYYTADIDLDIPDFKSKLGAKLPYYMIPAHYMHIDAVPLLPNGKMNRKALPKPDHTAYVGEYVAPRNDLETLLCRGFEKVLRRDRIGIRDDFFQMGGDSLKAIMLTVEVNLDNLSTMDIYNGNTVEKIAEIYQDRQQESQGRSAEEIEMEARSMPQPLTDMQLYHVDTQFRKAKSSMWSQRTLFRLQDISTIEKLEAAINKMVQNHPVFATFVEFNEDGALQQRYIPERTPVVKIEDVTDAELERLKATELVQPFYIFNSNLSRIRLFRTETAGYLFIDFHHMVIDGSGKQVLLRSLKNAYMDEPMFMDTAYSYLAEEARIKDSDAYIRAKEANIARYGNIDWISCPKPDNDISEFSIGVLPCKVSFSVAQMAEYEQTIGITRQTFFNLCTLLALHDVSGHPNVLVGSFFHNRMDEVRKNALMEVCKTVPLGLRIGSYRTLADLLNDAKEQAVESVANSIHGWQSVLNENSPTPDQLILISFETAAIMDRSSMQDIGLSHAQAVRNLTATAPADICQMVMETPEGFNSMIFYGLNRYSQETATRLANAVNKYAERLFAVTDPKNVFMEDFLR